MDDLISREQAIDALNRIINKFEQVLQGIRESKVDDSVCGMCEYDGAYIGQSGDWCNECPGFDKDDCFKLSDECRKRWLESVELPPAEKTGKWKRIDYADIVNGYLIPNYECSNCQNWVADMTDYCPNCGARMEG